MKSRISFLMKIFFLFFYLASSFFTASCRLMMLESKLDPESREFYSKVRYIISDEEKKIFLELPPSEREKFIQDFWKRRDPSPETEENEFKIDYLNKIETANRLFKGGGKPGYIQDRGRIYILLGLPDERYPSPVGKYSEAKSAEVWIYYKKYQIRLEFIDHSGDGEYTLERPSTQALYIINTTQLALKNPDKFREELFDFNVVVKETEKKDYFILIEIPYKNIWFLEKENQLEAELAVSLRIFDFSSKEIWQYQKDYQISLLEDEAKKLTGKNYSIKIPLNLEKGSYRATLSLENKIEEKKQIKKLNFTISK